MGRHLLPFSNQACIVAFIKSLIKTPIVNVKSLQIIFSIGLILLIAICHSAHCNLISLSAELIDELTVSIIKVVNSLCSAFRPDGFLIKRGEEDDCHFISLLNDSYGESENEITAIRHN